MHIKYEVSICYGSKVIAYVKVDNRQTDRQDKNNMSRSFDPGHKKSRGVCETLQYAPGGNKVEKVVFSFKVKVKVTRSLTLVLFERASLVEYACQI